MKQKHLEDDLYGFITKKLSPQKEIQYKTHLKECEKCRKEVEDISMTLELLDKFQPPPLSEEFQENVLRKIRELPLPEPPTTIFNKLREWYQYYVTENPWAFRGVAIGAVASLLIALTYPHFFFKSGDLRQTDLTTERSVKIEKSMEITLSPVKQPIIIETRDVDESTEKIKKIVSTQTGNILDLSEIPEGKKITIRLEKEKEAAFLEELNKLESVKKDGDNFRDGYGNILILLKRIK